MDIKERKKVTAIKDVVVGKKCDYCGSEIERYDYRRNNPFFEITTGHRDWGEDSGDSREHKDACSVDCLKVALDKYYANESRTSYIEIERRRF